MAKNNSLADRYITAFKFVLKNKWLYLIPLSLVLINQAYNTIVYYQASFFEKISPFQNQILSIKSQYLYYTFSDRLLSVLSQINWEGAIRNSIVNLATVIPLGGFLCKRGVMTWVPSAYILCPHIFLYCLTFIR